MSLAIYQDSKVYILYIHKKKIMFFECRISNLLVHTLYSQLKNYFFNMGFEVISYIYSMFTRKKIMFFQYRIKKNFDLNTST